MHLESSGYRARQHNLRRANAPITRGQLVKVVAEEVRLAMVRPLPLRSTVQYIDGAYDCI